MAATVQTIFDLFRYYNCARVTIYFIPFPFVQTHLSLPEKTKQFGKLYNVKSRCGEREGEIKMMQNNENVKIHEDSGALLSRLTGITFFYGLYKRLTVDQVRRKQLITKLGYRLVRCIPRITSFLLTRIFSLCGSSMIARKEYKYLLRATIRRIELRIRRRRKNSNSSHIPRNEFQLQTFVVYIQKGEDCCNKFVLNPARKHEQGPV